MVEFKASFNSANEMNAQFEDDEQFRTGLGEVIEAAGAVRYDREQDLTDEEKTQARENISAASESELTAHTNNSTIHVTSRDKAAWSSKYSLPPNGIPASDLEQAVRDALITPKTVIEAQYSHATGTTYFFETTERRGDIASIKPTLLRLKWNSTNISDTSSFDRYVVGVLSKRPTTSIVQAYIADFGEAGAYLLTSMGDSQPFSFSIRIEKFDAYFVPSTMKQTSLRLWSQTFSDAEKTQMRTNIGAASESDLTAHTSDTTIHVTAQDKIDWGAKYDKPSTGIPATDLEQKYAGSATAAGAANRTASIPFAQVDSTSTSTAFTAQVDGITELRDGVCCYLMNGVVTSASGWTLNVNGLGAKPVYQTLAAATRVTTLFNINYTMLFVYNENRVSGGCWDMVYGYNSDTNTIAYNVRVNAAAGTMNSQLYRYEILFTKRDWTLEPANNESNKPAVTTKALTTEAFDPFMPIYYYATTSAVAVGAAPSASYLYMQYASTDARYSFNKNDTLVAYAPVFLRCVPQADLTVKLDGDDCLVQALPTTADGKVYLYLGRANNATTFWLSQNHPIYEFVNGALRMWTGA